MVPRLYRANTTGITHVLVPAFTGRDPVVYPNQLVYMTLNIRDIQGVGILYEFPRAFKFINHVKAINGKILVHCAQGISRSASFVVAYLMKCNHWTYTQADTYIKKIRPVVSTVKFEDQLRIWEQLYCEFDDIYEKSEHKSELHKERSKTVELYQKQYKPATVGRNADVIPDLLQKYE